MTVFSPGTHQPLIIRHDGLGEKFWSPDFIAATLAHMNVLDVHIGTTAPGETSQLWFQPFDTADQGPGSFRIWDAPTAQWVPMTPLRFMQWLVQRGLTGNAYVTRDEVRSSLRLFPEVATATGKLSVTAPSTGQVRVAANQIFTHRGIFARNTSETAEGLRTFSTAANRTYHLRWRSATGYHLLDLSDGGYNPSSHVETNAVFDTTFDDMLIARVVTSGSNAATITSLVNRNALFASTKVRVNNTYRQVNWGAMPGSAFTLDWSRTPVIAHPVLTGVSARQDVPDGNPGGDGALMCALVRNPSGAASLPRYGAAHAEFVYDDEERNYGVIELLWTAAA